MMMVSMMIMMFFTIMRSMVPNMFAQLPIALHIILLLFSQLLFDGFNSVMTSHMISRMMKLFQLFALRFSQEVGITFGKNVMMHLVLLLDGEPFVERKKVLATEIVWLLGKDIRLGFSNPRVFKGEIGCVVTKKRCNNEFCILKKALA